MKKTLFTFDFDNSKKLYCRKYCFQMIFLTVDDYEKALDWAETSGEIEKKLLYMNQFGMHEISYDPSIEFFGVHAFNINPKVYITIMTLWKSFFTENNIICGDIEEVIEDKRVA